MGSTHEDDDSVTMVELPLQLCRRRTGSRIILGDGAQGSGQPDANLVRLISGAYRWNRILAEGEVNSLQELSRMEQIDRSDIGRTLNLAYLAPDIVEAILDGRQPNNLTAKQLKRMTDLPLDWDGQRRALGIET